MAYSTGDDASRWFMVVDYFRHNFFEYWKTTEETLYWRLGERPLQNISGALFCSLFNCKQAIGYSLSAASSLIMSSLAFCLVLESLFKVEKEKSRFILWAVSIVFFGFFGTMTNIFYTGRTTHHFSVYPVIASLGFFVVKDKFPNRFIWFLFWNVSLAYYYSIRFSINYMMLVLFILGFQWIFREIKFKSLFKNYAALFIAFIASVAAAWGEVAVILEKFKTEGYKFFLMQREKGYGSDGSTSDRIMKWSGFISTFELSDSIPRLIFYSLSVMIILSIVAAIYKSLISSKRSVGYSGLITFNFIMGTYLFLSSNYYVAWKSALYWPIYILIGITALGIEFMDSESEKKKKISVYIFAFIFLFIGLTGRQLNFYWTLANQRFTKVDNVSYEMLDVLQKRSAEIHKSVGSVKIYGVDYSAERHLLLREIFKQYKWQPVRQKELWFEHDMVIADSNSLDDYNYDFLVYANTYDRGEWSDLSGNQNSKIYEHYPFTIFSNNSSFVEFKSGIVTQIYEARSEERYPVYGGFWEDDLAKIQIINNGKHEWYKFEFRIYGDKTINVNNKINVTLNGKVIPSPFKYMGEMDDFRTFELNIKGISKDRLPIIKLIKDNFKEKIYITKTVWGY